MKRNYKTVRLMKRNYKTVLKEVGELVGKAGLAAYDRAKLLCEVFDDRQFQHDIGGDDYNWASALDKYTADLAVDFLELKALVAHYPEREQWGDGNLKGMRVKMMNDHREARKSNEEPKPVAERATKKQVAELREDNALLEKKLSNYSQTIESSNDRMALLEKENARLREENAELRGRVAELEKIARRELVAA